MISISTIVAIIKCQSALATLGVVVINLIEAERTRQYELVRELGTLACNIENARIVNRPYSHLQAKYNELARKRR